MQASCSSDEITSPYPIIDSGMWATGDSLSSDIVWLDDEHILFDGKKYITSVEDRALIIWRIGKGFEYYKTNASGICFSQGTIRYTAYKNALHTKKDRTIFQGQFRKEKPIDESNARFFDKLNCRALDYRPVEKYGRGQLFLLEGHGYLDFGAAGDTHSKSPVLFYKDESSKPIELPFHKQEISSSQIKYYPFKQAYLIFGRYENQYALIKKKSLSGAIPQPLWWVYPDGDVEEVTIPPGPWLLGGSTFLRATKEGIFISYLGGKATSTSGQGIYFIKGDQFQKIVGGFAIAPAVSPDGCRVAYSHKRSSYESVSERNRMTLKVINFCEHLN